MWHFSFSGQSLKILCLLLLTPFFVSCGNKETSAAKTNRPSKPPSTEDIFTNSQVLRIRITIPKEGIAALKRSHWESGGGSKRPIAKATVEEGDHVYTNVAIHLKGAAGSWQPINDRPALTLNFDKFAEGQDFHGFRKISLNNSVQDRSYLSEKISREMFEAAGVPVPRADHAKVELNGRDLGLYVLVEGYNKQFLKRYFHNTKGNLYDGGFLREVTDELTANSGDKPEDQSDREALVKAAFEPDAKKRLARLEQVLDLDRFLSFLAMEVMLCHWDGYAMNKNNYRLFHDLDSNRMVFFPHGLDQMFGVDRVTPNCPVLPHLQGVVAKAVLQTSEGRQRYLGRMSQLLTNVFRVEALTNRVNELAAKIRPVIAEGSSRAAKQHENSVAALNQRIARRAESLRQQLGDPPTALVFDDSGVVRLSGWKSKADSGNPSFKVLKGAPGKDLLHISASGGRSVASWRTRVALDKGRYRLEGRAKVEGVDIDPADQRGGGVCLRISRGRPAKKISGTSGWTDLPYEFDVQEGMPDVELVCELRALKGEAWFDAASLKLVRE